jgi:biotin carboxyl carrier protein
LIGHTSKLEAMKMEHTIRSGADGVVQEIYFTAGEQVIAEAQLLRIKAID